MVLGKEACVHAGDEEFCFVTFVSSEIAFSGFKSNIYENTQYRKKYEESENW